MKRERPKQSTEIDTLKEQHSQEMNEQKNRYKKLRKTYNLEISKMNL